jgi:hypothetical protein
VQRFAYLSFAGRCVELSCPAEFEGLVPVLLGAGTERPGDPIAQLAILAEGPERYTLMAGSESVSTGGLGQIMYEALVAAERLLSADLPDQLLLHAGAVAHDGKAVLIAGESRSGKSMVAAALLGQGFDSLSDEITTLAADGVIDGLRRPLTIRADVWNEVSQLGWISQVVSLADGRRLAQAPGNRVGPAKCGLIIVPQFTAGASARLERVATARAAALLMARNHSWQHASDHGFGTMLALAAAAPAVRLVYGDVKQLAPLAAFADRVLESGRDVLELAILEANAAFEAGVTSKPQAPAASIPAATPKKGPVRLTIGMATYDDYDGVYFTVQALRMYHPAVLKDTEFLVIDNHPEGIAAAALKDLDTHIANYRYLPLPGRNGTSHSRDMIFREAEGRYVLVLDCHVLLQPGAIDRLLAYFDAHPETNDLIQGPLVYDELNHWSPQWDPVWRAGMFGTWANDPRADVLDGEPFDIPLQGLGLFACRREAWLGFNPRFRGFGGEEGYIHEKFRQNGRRALCLPGLRWVHRFGRPAGPPYVNRWEDRMFNYYLGLRELGLPTADMEAHFGEVLGAEVAGRIMADIRREVDAIEAPMTTAMAG